jgi:hypothetical protein
MLSGFGTVCGGFDAWLTDIVCRTTWAADNQQNILKIRVWVESYVLILREKLAKLFK